MPRSIAAPTAGIACWAWLSMPHAMPINSWLRRLGGYIDGLSSVTDARTPAVYLVPWGVVTMVLAHAAGPVVGMDVARNVTLLPALALLTRRSANEATAAAAGLMFLTTNVALGRAYNPDGHTTHTWRAVALYPSSSMAAWLAATALFALALRLASSRARATR
ncbi:MULTISPECIES: hypothetical protein [unclassified Streptomyces]|uniref:hypothetical protein n=1 Tax=unclassified Streptomyces TaxID=2593676 RepID=UPI0038022AC6